MPLGSRLQPENILEGRRGRIYDTILGRPGVTFTEIVRAVGGPFGVFLHHLYVLERFGLVHTYRTGRNRRYYASIEAPEDTRRDAFLREPHLRDTFVAIAADPGATQQVITARLAPLTRQAVGHRLSRLVEVGAVRACRDGRLVRYEPLADVPEPATEAHRATPSVATSSGAVATLS